MSNGIVSTEKEEEEETEDPAINGTAEQRPEQVIATRSEAGETPGIKMGDRMPDSGLSKNRHFESSDED